MNTVKTLICVSALLHATSAYANDPPAPAAQPQTPTARKTAKAAPTRGPAPARGVEAGSVSDAPAVAGKPGYPRSFVHRPLLLPERMAQVESAVVITNDPGQTGSNMNLGLDVGLARKLGGGLLLSLPLTPDGGFGMLVANVQYALAPLANLRFDVGAARLSQELPAMGGATAMQSTTGFVWGVGLPVKWRVADRIALTTGRSTASAFGGASKINGNLLTSDDLVTMSSGSFNAMDGSTISTTVWTFGLPLGMIAQVHDRIGLGLRTGFRLVRGDGVADDTAIPLAFDVMTHPAKPLDLGLTFELPGWTRDYGAVQNVSLWAQTRF